MIKIDMHIHTCASDGTWNVYELKEELLRNKINIFSVTDHDDIVNSQKAMKITELTDNIICIPGVELTTTYCGKEYHLTMYNYKATYELNELLSWSRQCRLDYNLEYMKKYAFVKYEKTRQKDYDDYIHIPESGGWKSLNYMKDMGIYMNNSEYFEDIRKSGLQIVFKNPEQVINISKKTGGSIFLAHPSYYYKDHVMPTDHLKYWVELGIDGIECYSPYNGTYTAEYLKFCKNNNLMISGGSDCHGTFIPERKLGVPNINLDDLNINRLL